MGWDPAEDDSLAQHAREGDPSALAKLYHRHAAGLLAYANRLVNDSCEAEDVLQESFLKLMESRGRFEGQGRFRQWLYTVGRRIALDRRRTDLRRLKIAERSKEEIQPDHGASEVLLFQRYRHLTRLVDEVLAEMPASYGETFHLRIREGFSYSEIAEILGEPSGTLRSRIHHVIRRIRELLEVENRKEQQT